MSPGSTPPTPQVQSAPRANAPHADSRHSNSLVIKLGGSAAGVSAGMRSLAAELVELDTPTVLVHGGGKEVTLLSERLGITPVFHDGVRMTTAQEMDIVEMVLSGVANKRLVRLLLGAGVRAVGISGSDARTVLGTPIRDAAGAESRTATIAAVDPSLIITLWDGGYLPVVSPTSVSADFGAVNINADDVAFGLAGALRVRSLVFLSDVAGILVDGAPLEEITPAEAATYIERGVITGGMIPKVRNALTAIESGVSRVVIGSYDGRGDLSAMLRGERGTVISGRWRRQ